MAKVCGNAIKFDGFKLVLQMPDASVPFKTEYLAQMAADLADVPNANAAANYLWRCNNDGSWAVIDGPHYVEVPSRAW